jgi:ribosomal protein S18 acetylase RimI-like enzyme
MVELQDYERALEAESPGGPALADAHLAHMADRCRRYDGRVLVAATADEVVGFVCVLAAVPSDAPGDPAPYAYISDLVVLPAHRRRGIAGLLVRRAEEYARSRGAALLRVGVLARNAPARRLYEAAGFRDHQIQLQRRLRP